MSYLLKMLERNFHNKELIFCKDKKYFFKYFLLIDKKIN